jgi:pilus assembly protein Flp/PilA
VPDSPTVSRSRLSAWTASGILFRFLTENLAALFLSTQLCSRVHSEPPAEPAWLLGLLGRNREDAAMKKLARSLIDFMKREDGVTAVECALMLALIVLICIISTNTLKSKPQVDDTVVAEAPQQ